jgi:hypothetical protein
VRHRVPGGVVGQNEGAEKESNENMTETDISADEIEIGPIDYLVVEYPDGRPTGEALPYLIDLVDRGIIRVLDAALVVKDADGTVSGLSLGDLSDSGGDLALLDGAATGIIDDTDLAEAGSVLAPGAVGAILVYENTWAAGFAAALRRAGGQLVAQGRIPVNAILAAVEQADELED